MGTSSSYGGTPNRSPLVPSWVGDLGAPLGLPIPSTPAQDVLQPENPGKDRAVQAPIPAAGNESRFMPARSNFTAYARGGGTGGASGAALGRALRSYVGSGSGGRRGAAQRMAPSRRTAAKIGGFIRDVQRLGSQQALRQLGCGDLVGKPAAEALSRLVDAFCPEGGPIDESIARQAFQETVIEWAERDLPPIDALSLDQWNELLVDFISRSVEVKIYEDIGTKGIAVPADARSALRVQQDLHVVIAGCVRNAFSERVSGFQNLQDPEISLLMESVYERAWGFVEAVGGEA